MLCRSMNSNGFLLRPHFESIGGLLVNATRLAYLSCDIYRGKVEPYFKELEELGLWTRLERTILPNYSWNNDGVVYVYRRN